MCEWCGDDHAVTQLCSARPKWSRRGFISLISAAALGAMLPVPTLAFRADAFAIACAPLGIEMGNTFKLPTWIVQGTGHYVHELHLRADGRIAVRPRKTIS